MKYFLYEMDFAGRWCPIFIQLMKEPGKFKPKADKDPEQSQHWPVGDELTLEEAQLQYPAPANWTLKASA